MAVCDCFVAVPVKKKKDDVFLMKAATTIAEGVVALKHELVKKAASGAHTYEAVPLEPSGLLPVEPAHLAMLHRFASANPIYYRSSQQDLLGVPCMVYEGDINEHWLSSVKHDTSYQAFYPTWIMSAYALVHEARRLGFGERATTATTVVDIGSGDGRIAYCAGISGTGALGIEIDGDLAGLQKAIFEKTEVRGAYVMHADATRFDYATLGMSGPAVFFISAMPEMGEMLAQSVISQVLALPDIEPCFVFMGSHSLKKYSRDLQKWGWGSVIDRNRLQVISTLTLPTQWTMDQELDTAYVFAAFRHDNNNSSGNSDSSNGGDSSL